MKVELKYSYDDQEEYANFDKASFLRLQKADDAFVVLSELDQYLRGRLKWEDLDASEAEKLEEIQRFMHHTLGEHGIDLEVLLP